MSGEFGDKASLLADPRHLRLCGPVMALDFRVNVWNIERRAAQTGIRRSHATCLNPLAMLEVRK